MCDLIMAVHAICTFRSYRTSSCVLDSEDYFPQWVQYLGSVAGGIIWTPTHTSLSATGSIRPPTDALRMQIQISPGSCRSWLIPSAQNSKEKLTKHYSTSDDLPLGRLAVLPRSHGLPTIAAHAHVVSE